MYDQFTSRSETRVLTIYFALRRLIRVLLFGQASYSSGLIFYLEIHRVCSRRDARLRATTQREEQIAEGLNSNDKRQRRIATGVQNRNRSRRGFDNKFPGRRDKEFASGFGCVAPRVHVSRSSAAASEQWGFGCTIFNGDNPTCREGLVARESNLLCHRIT